MEQNIADLDRNRIIGAVLLDLSKAIDYIPHELLVAKLNAYGFDRQALKLIYSYLKERTQSLHIIISIKTFLIYYQMYHKVPYWGSYYLIPFQTIYSCSLRKSPYITMQMTIHFVDRSQMLHRC